MDGDQPSSRSELDGDPNTTKAATPSWKPDMDEKTKKK